MARANIRRNYRKIDIYRKVPHGLVYLCSTTWSPNLKAARVNWAEANPGQAAASDLKAFYAEK